MLLSVDYSPNNLSYFIHLVSLCSLCVFYDAVVFFFLFIYLFSFFFVGGGGAYIVTYYVVLGIENCVKLEFLIYIP